MKKIFRNIRISNFPKNLLILFPLIITGNLNKETNFDIIISSLLLFFLITSICYLINDYSDKEIDKINKLKNNPNLNKKKFLFYLIPLVFVFIFSIIYFDQIYNYYLYLYILNFLIYNYFGKKIKYLDIMLLTNFYMLRILYGVQVFNLEISLGFILFSITLFLSLSIIKRLTQIKINNLNKKNLVISYDSKSSNLLKIIFNITFTLNIIISTFYLINNLGFLNFTNNFFIYTNQFPKEKMTILYFIYIIMMLNTFLNIAKNKINKDIYLFFISSKFNLFLFFFSITIIAY